MRRTLSYLLAWTLGAALLAPAHAQTPEADEQKAEAVKAPVAVKPKALDEFIKDKDHIPGLFDFYRNRLTGELFMQVTREQLGQEFIYFRYTVNGAVANYLTGVGEIADNSVFTLRRRFNRIDFILLNTAYVFPENSPLARHADINVSSPLLAVTRIAAENADGSVVLVPVDDVFTRNRFVAIGGDKQGQLSKEKSSIRSVRSYPDNSEIVAEYVFDTPNARSPALSSTTVTIQHNLIRMPAPGFVSRRDDPRVGYFIEKRTDLTRLSGLQYDDYIDRWRLVKKDPKAAVSDPVQPIVYWIENTTPYAYRDTIRAAVLKWNEVFEQAGISNAIRVEVQPDDAEWDAGDIRYNVLRWVATPAPRFLAYGPRFTNPRTGEILGADIVLEHTAVRRSVMYGTLYGESSPVAPTGPGGPGGENAPEAHGHSGHSHEQCMAAAAMRAGVDFARVAMQTGNTAAAAEDIDEIIRQGLYYVVMHEVGHTLGLSHNMMGSYYYPPDKLNGPGSREEQRLVNSVMDYPAVNISADRRAQGLYFPTAPGPYDYWAIAFGYDERVLDGAYRTALLKKSSLPELRFGNDADAMAKPDQGIDPRVNTFDLSSDPIAFAIGQVQLSDTMIGRLRQYMARPGQSWDEVRRSFETLLNVRREAGKTISRYVAGVYVDRAFVGQETSAPAPFTPVSYADKKRAMSALGRYIFSPGAFTFPDELIGYLQEQRRGFDFWGFPRQDPLVHAWVRAIQDTVFVHLLDSRVLRRQTDSALYGNQYSVHEMMADLYHEIFAADNGKEVNSFRRGLQVSYVQRVLKTFKSGTLDATAEAALFATLERIHDEAARPSQRLSAETRSHRQHLRYMIDQGLEKDKEKT